MFNKSNLTKSFSLIEVLVFVAVIALFFVVASAGTVVTLRNMKTNEHKIIATRYAQELMEWLRNEKETDWNTFATNAVCTSNKCFYDLSWSGSCNLSCSKVDGIYTRVADFQSLPSAKISVTVRVTWSELGNTYTVPIQSTFSFLD